MDDVCKKLCDLIGDGKRWENLSVEDWLSILGNDQYFTKKCDSVNGWGLFSGNSWVRLLIEHPELEDVCDRQNGWDAFNISDWISLIEKCPELAKEKCRRTVRFKDICNELGVCELAELLIDHPSFADAFPRWNNFEAKDLEEIGCFELQILLEANPNFVDVYPLWEKIDAENWVSLLNALPHLVEKCDEVKGWEKFGDRRWDSQGCNGVAWVTHKETYWASILSTYPEWSNRCDKFDGWNKFDPRDWVALLKQQPQFIDKVEQYNGWFKFEGFHWVSLLQQQPQFSNQCDKVCGWKNFNGFDWVELLRDNPGFSAKCDLFDGWQKIDFAAVSYMYQFKGADYVVHGVIVDSSRNDIRISRVIQSSVCVGHIDFIGDITEDEYTYYGTNNQIVTRSRQKPIFCGRWAELLERQPQFAIKCDEFNGWEVFDGLDWFRLLSAQPHFVKKCNELNGWKKLFYYRPVEHHYNDEENGNTYEYSHERLFDVPAEYGKDFSSERILPADACLEGVPVDCWLTSIREEVNQEKNLDELELYFGALQPKQDNQKKSLLYGQINLAKDEVVALKEVVNKSFWIYLLGQNPILAISLAAQYGISGIWETFTLDDWKVAIKNRTDFINCMKDFDDKGSPEYNPRNDFFDEEFWEALVATWPDFFKELGYWTQWRSRYDEGVKVECETWAYFIRHKPEWVVHMKRNDWTKFDKNDWMRLLDPHWHFLEKETIVQDDWFWWNCLSQAPGLAELCERNGGWGKLSNNQVADLIIKYSELTRIGVKYLNWDALSDDDWMRLINARPQFARKYIKTHSSDEVGKRTEAEIIEKAKEFITREERIRLVRPMSDDLFYDDYADWREASGWNDAYGNGVEASDIIEFRD